MRSVQRLLRRPCWAPGSDKRPTIYSGYDPNPDGAPGTAVPTNPNSSAAEASFLAAITGEGTESFESFLNGSPPPYALSFSGSSPAVSATLTGSGFINRATRAVPATGETFAIDGEQFFQALAPGFNIAFAAPVVGFGSYLIDFEIPDGVTATLTYAGGGTEVFNLSSIFGYAPGAESPTGSVHYLGFVADPFTSISFSGIGGRGDQIGFDRMTAAAAAAQAVPEPGTWALLLVGLGLAGFGLRRRRGRESLLSAA